VKFGLFGINIGPCARPESAARVARAAEDAGFDSVWTGEHVVLPDPQAPPSPAPPGEPFLDPAVALAFLAAHTERLRLATGVVILPQRNPLVLAKELASVDVLSGGRLVFGIGAGYLRPEFEAIGTSFHDRGARTDEYLEAILALWTQEKPAFAGRTVRFSGIDAHPRPVQRPHPPIVVGGMSSAAFRRAARVGDGWYGFLQDVDATARCLEGLAAAARDVGRPATRGKLEISITPLPGLSADVARRYAALGVHRLVLLPTERREEDLLRFIAQAGKALVRELA
jgi:probable F420-dependent oxidoreductase